MDKISFKESCDILHEDKWVSLYKTKEGFTFSHESFADGKKVGVLPFRITNNGIEVLVIYEMNPAWNLHIFPNRNEKVKFATIITGSVENNDPILTMVNELYEEGGYKSDEEDFIFIGGKFLCKSNTSKYFLSIIDLTLSDQEFVPKGDNGNEELEWMSIEDAMRKSDDFLLKLLCYEIRSLIK